MAIKKPNLSSVVKSQLPEFVREDYQTFIAFLEAYYTFIKNNYDVDLLETRDVDNTLDEFVKYFKSEFGKDIPQTLVDDRFLIKHVKDYYLTKGTEVSYQILLALLYGKNVTLSYPGKQMLRASDGKWNQDVSVFARVNAGNTDMVVGRIIDVVTPTRIIRVQVDKTQNVEIEVDRVRKIAENIYEFYIDRRFFGKISVGDRMRYSDVFDATILSTTAAVTIQRPGKHFKAGELYEVKNGAGIGSILKVSSVDANGSIISLQFVKFGIGYTTDFTATLLPIGGTSATSAGSGSLSIGGISPSYNIEFGETTNGFTEQGYVNKTDYNNQTPEELSIEGAGAAWDGTYVGDVVREFFSDNKFTILDPDEPAVIRIALGPLTKYPGYYTTNDGFLDDAIFIQDSKYYQAFSYVLKVDERLENYKSIVKTLLHPTGMALFGEYDLRNEFDLGTSLESMLKYLALTLHDEVIVTNNEFTIKGFGKTVSDSVSTDELYVSLLNKPLGSQLDYDLNTENTSVSLADNINIKNFGKTVNTTLLYDGVTFDDNTVTPSEESYLNADGITYRKGISNYTVSKTLNSVLYDHKLYDDATLDSDLVYLTETTQARDISKVLETNYLNDGITADTTSVSISDTTGTNSTRTMPYVVLNKSISATTLNYDGSLDDETVTVSSDTGAYWLNPYNEPYPFSDSYFLNDSGDYTTGESAFSG
jgi:hypothetical protein